MQTTSRERTLAALLVVALAAWALYGLVLKPARARIETLQRIIPEKQAQLRDLRAKSAEYAALKRTFDQRRATLASYDPDFQLLPFLDAMIERHRLTQQATLRGRDTLQSQPDSSAIAVTIELRNVSLKQIVEFLRDVNISPSAMRIGGLRIRKAPNNEGRLDSTIEIADPKPGRLALAPQLAP